MRKYLVTFHAMQQGQSGYGNAEWAQPEPISGYQHVKLIEQQLAKSYGLQAVTVLSFQLFESPVVAVVGKVVPQAIAPAAG